MNEAGVFIISYILIGSLFAYRMAISPIAVVVLTIAWPIFLVLIVISYPLNAYLNKRDGFK